MIKYPNIRYFTLVFFFWSSSINFIFPKKWCHRLAWWQEREGVTSTGDMPVTRGGGGVKNSQFCGDIIFEWPLFHKMVIKNIKCLIIQNFPEFSLSLKEKFIFSMNFPWKFSKSSLFPGFQGFPGFPGIVWTLLLRIETKNS